MIAAKIIIKNGITEILLDWILELLLLSHQLNDIRWQ